MTFFRTVGAYLTGWLIVQPIYNRLLNAYRRRELERPGSATNAYFARQASEIIKRLTEYTPAQQPPVALDVIVFQHAEIERLRRECARQHDLMVGLDRIVDLKADELIRTFPDIAERWRQYAADHGMSR